MVAICRRRRRTWMRRRIAGSKQLGATRRTRARGTGARSRGGRTPSGTPFVGSRAASALFEEAAGATWAAVPKRSSPVPATTDDPRSTPGALIGAARRRRRAPSGSFERFIDEEPAPPGFCPGPFFLKSITWWRRTSGPRRRTCLLADLADGACLGRMGTATRHLRRGPSGSTQPGPERRGSGSWTADRARADAGTGEARSRSRRSDHPPTSARSPLIRPTRVCSRAIAEASSSAPRARRRSARARRRPSGRSGSSTVTWQS